MQWWKNSIVYQIYPRSFQDSNGDGIGDLKGIVKRLGHLSMLGVDVIWLSPVYKSPNDDNGYDISDYESIMPEFGTMDDMEFLIEEASKLNIKIIMDLVVNHTSDEHPWFVESRKGKESPYEDYYIWRKTFLKKEPNDLKSAFGGSAWAWDEMRKAFYLHLFSKKQPDLNWANPKVRQDVYSMMRFWIDKGIAGFRMDVIELIGKEPDEKITANGPKLHEYIQEMNREVLKGKDLLTVGECWSAGPEDAIIYSNPDGSELSMVFQFEHMVLDQEEGGEKWDLKPLSLVDLKKVLTKWQTALYGKGWNSLFWENHDLPRIISRWGDDKDNRVECAKMFATLLYCMQGTPYIYQGQEIGMTNADYDRIGNYRDIETKNMYKARTEKGQDQASIMKAIHVKSRDNARTPMQWDNSKNGGFSNGKPWIPINANYVDINAFSQYDDSGSIFNYYRALLAFRKKERLIQEGAFELLMPDSETVFAYQRTDPSDDSRRLLIVCNFTKEAQEILLETLGIRYGEEVSWLLGSPFPLDFGRSIHLRPYESMILEVMEVKG